MRVLHHVRRGEGEPLLLVHGIGSHCGVWEPAMDALAAHHDVVAVDLPGFGRSPALRTGKHDVDGLVAPVEALLDDLGWDQAHLVGNSLGGLVSLELARRGRARTVVAISPAGGARGWEDTYARAVLGYMRWGARIVAPLADRLANRPIGRRLLAGTVMARPHLCEAAWLAEQTRVFASGEGFEEVAAHLDARRVLARYTQLTVPVRIAWGTRDAVLLPRQARRFVERIPGAELVMMPGLGHTPMSDDPERVAQVILAVSARTSRRPAV